jgi:drug/metabolite transporter (DMT)-like permease
VPAQIAAFDAPTWWRLGYLVLAGAVAAPLLQVMAQRSLPPGRIALLFALEPVFALVFAATVGGERFVLRWWVGAVLILCAVVLVEGRAAMERPAPPSATA